MPNTANKPNSDYLHDIGEDVLIDIQKVTKVTSLSKASIYRLIQAERFPKGKELLPGARRVA